MGQRKKGSDARAHGIADNIGLGDFEMVEKPERVLRHGWAGIGFRIVEFIAGAVAAIVERDGAEAVPGQEPHPARIAPVGLRVGGEAVNEQDRLAFALHRKGDFHAIEEKNAMPGLSDDAASDVGNRVAEVKHTVRTFGYTVMKKWLIVFMSRKALSSAGRAAAIETMHGHDHHHGHNHENGPQDFHAAFAIGTGLNIALVGLQVTYGVIGHSVALLADAGHNLGDVFGLLLAWGASAAARRAPSSRYTYGLRSSSILAALANAIILLIAVGAIALEALQRFGSPEPVQRKR